MALLTKLAEIKKKGRRGEREERGRGAESEGRGDEERRRKAAEEERERGEVKPRWYDCIALTEKE